MLLESLSLTTLAPHSMCETKSEKWKVRNRKWEMESEKRKWDTIPWVGSADWQQKAEKALLWKESKVNVTKGWICWGSPLGPLAWASAAACPWACCPAWPGPGLAGPGKPGGERRTGGEAASPLPATHEWSPVSSSDQRSEPRPGLGSESRILWILYLRSGLITVLIPSQLLTSVEWCQPHQEGTPGQQLTHLASWWIPKKASDLW